MNDLEDLPSWAGRVSTGETSDPPTDEKTRRRGPWLAALAGLLLVGGGGVVGYIVAGGQDDPPDEAAGPATSTTSTPSTTETPRSSSADVEETATSEPATRSSVALSLADFSFTISGVVPDQESADSIETAMKSTYGQFGASDLKVDPEAEVEPWLDEMPFIVQNFNRILDGSLSIDDGGVTLDGRSPNQDSIDFLTDALSTNSGFPELVANDVEVVRLDPPEIEAVATEGVVTLQGVLPSDTLRDRIVADIAALYGDDNVIDEVDIDDETFARFDLIRFGGNVGLFQQADDYEIGVRDGGFYVVLGEGISFDVASTELNGTAQDLLDGFPELLERNTLDLNIVGHTDDIGSEPDNLALSEARADAVAQFLSSAGVDPSRLVVIGAGETEPIALNSTVEGRAKNRRVVLTMGFDS